MKQNFSHLHVHTDASMIDGLGSVNRTVSHAKTLGFDKLAITDHGSLTNTLLFNQTCREHGIKPIIGLEGYVGLDGERFHITLLANGNEGFKNLVALNNIGVENTGHRPTFEISDFKKHNKDIFVLSGCPESPVQSQRLSYGEAKDNFRYLKKIFGSRLFVEMMLVNYGTPYKRAISLSEEFNAPLVVTNDVHFAKKEDAPLHLRLLQMKTGGFTYNSEHLFLATSQELESRLTDDFNRKDILHYLQKGMGNAEKLAEKLGEVRFDSRPKLPNIPNSDKKLWRLIEEGFKNRVEAGQIPDNNEYRDRYRREFNTIKQMEFCTYFVILQDIVGYAHKNDIWVGKGRGSGAGSLVLYLIGITEVDPIKFDLYFERFLNSKREDMPDVDVDFESEGRDRVIEYAIQRYDAKPIATYSRFGHKSSLIDLRKNFRLPDKLAKEAGEHGEESEQFKQLCDQYPEFEDMYYAIKNQIRHMGKHAGGVVINVEGFPLPMVKTSRGGDVVAWTEGQNNRELSRVGLVKFDLLSTAKGSALKRLQDKLGVVASFPTDDHEVFQLFRDGNTSGVFQFGSDGIVGLLKDVQPTNIEDLIAVNALFRPGSLGSGSAFLYPELKRKNSQRLLHKDIDHFLTKTYGIICYQEQFMEIIGFVLGGDMADADMARKVLSKKDVKKLPQLEKQFFDGASAIGWTHQEIQDVWDEIKTHSDYSFNRSHAVAYALVAWEMAWFKYYYPVDFYCELLNVESHDSGKVESYMIDVVLSGIEIKYPDINKSTNEYVAVADENAIYLPLTAIKYVSDKSYAKINQKRPFTSLKHYMDTVPKAALKKRGREGFLVLGVFDGIERGFSDILDVYDYLGVDDGSNLTEPQKQKKYLGYILPSKDFVQAKEEAESFGMICGFVDSIEVRNKGRGDYKVVKMLPTGSFWYKDFKRFDVNEGDAVAVLKSDWGEANEIYEIPY